MDWLIGIVNSLGGATPSVLIGVLLASMILLLIKNKIRFPLKYSWILWVCLVFSGSLLVGIGMVKGYEYVLEKEHKKAQYAGLEFLTPEEKKVLKSFISKKKINGCWNQYRFDGALKALERDGVIYLIYKDTKWPWTNCYNIERWAYFYLQEHPNLLN